MREIAVAFAATLFATGPVQAASVPRPQGYGATTLYRVRPGDTLSGLVARLALGHGGAISIQHLNGLRDPDFLRDGAVIHVPARPSKAEPASLTAAAVTGTVFRIASSGARVILVKGGALKRGDRITTGPNSFVTLTQPDGTRVTLPSNTTMRVARLELGASGRAARSDFVIESGRGEMAVTPLRGTSDRFDIRTPAAVAAVRGTEFRVAYDAGAARSTLEVIEGIVAEASVGGGASKDIITGEAAQRARGGARRIIPLPAAPELQPPGDVQVSRGWVFRIAHPKSGYSYHFLLARDPAITDIVAERTVSEGVARFDPIAAKTLIARVTAIDEHGVEGFPRDYNLDRLQPGSAIGTGG